MDGYKGTSYIDMVDEVMKNPEKLPKLKNLVYLGKNKVPEHMTLLPTSPNWAKRSLMPTFSKESNHSHTMM